METLNITAPIFNLKWVLHNMGDELSGVYLALFGVKPYVGITKDRTKRNKNGTDFSKGYNRKVKNAFNKHGVTDFMFISCNMLSAFVIEGFFLENFEEMVENGDDTICNLKFSYGQGGATRTGMKNTTEHRAKMSGEKNHQYGKTGEKSPNYGKKRTPEARAKQSEANSGEKHPQYGKTGEKSHSFGKKASPETRAKLSESKSGEKHPSYDDTVYNFQHKDGSKETCTQWALRTKYNLHHSHLSEVVSGKRRSVGGWRLSSEIT